jgi:hypothetical protein
MLGETIIPFFKGQEVQEPLLLEWQAVPKCWNDQHCVAYQNSDNLIYIATDACNHICI